VQLIANAGLGEEFGQIVHFALISRCTCGVLPFSAVPPRHRCVFFATWFCRRHMGAQNSKTDPPPYPTMPKTCGHNLCHLSLSNCCHCSDKRPAAAAGSYERYVDGKGWLPGGNRSDHYCPACKRTSRPAAPVPVAAPLPPRPSPAPAAAPLPPRPSPAPAAAPLPPRSPVPVLRPASLRALAPAGSPCPPTSPRVRCGSDPAPSPRASAATGASPLEQLLECIVCFGRMILPVTLCCGHSFCKACVNQLVPHGSRACVSCRACLTASLPHPSTTRAPFTFAHPPTHPHTLIAQPCAVPSSCRPTCGIWRPRFL